MIERLARALEHIEEVPEDVQEDLAEQIEQFQLTPTSAAHQARSFAGIWRDLPDEVEETLLRWRREAPPTATRSGKVDSPAPHPVR